jgi:hypothetical protein
MKTGYASLLIGLMVSQVGAQDMEDPPSPVAISLQASFNFGPLDGFLQTPSGGGPGTSSKQRPTFDELGLNDVIFYDTRLDVQWHRARLYGGYQFIRLDGSTTLSQPLVSHGRNFAAGDSVRTDDQLDWARAGFGWQLDFLNHRLEVVPSAEMAFLAFDYHLSSSSQSADRSYIKGAARLGVETTYHLNSRVSLNLDGSASLPLSNTPQIATLAATTNFRLFSNNWRVKPSLFAGIGAEWIDYEDNQKLSNHIKADIGPFLTTGFSVSF